MILNATKYGLFVELDDLFVEGLVPIDSLRDDHYTYRENTREIIGSRNHRKYFHGAESKGRPRPDRCDPEAAAIRVDRGGSAASSRASRGEGEEIREAEGRRLEEQAGV
jgi:hypothetical protein